MQPNQNINLISKTLLIGCFIASLIYFFHPEAEQFSIVVNGDPVAEPLVRFAIIPTILAVMIFTSILIVLAFFGIGLLIFLLALLFMIIGVVIIAPYSWPILVIVFLMIALMSLGNNNTR